MKLIKSILIVLILLVTTISYSQDDLDTKVVEVEKVSSTVVYNDAKSVGKQIYSDVKSLGPEVKEALGQLANTFNTTIDKLWNILVRQQLVYSIVYLILTLSALLNWLLFYKRNFRRLGKNDYIIGKKSILTLIDNPKFDQNYYDRYKQYEGRPGWDDNTNNIQYKKKIESITGQEDIIVPLEPKTLRWFKYLHLGICLTLSVFSFYHFSDMLTGFINPEYGALQNIVNVAQQLK